MFDQLMTLALLPLAVTLDLIGFVFDLAGVSDRPHPAPAYIDELPDSW